MKIIASIILSLFVVLTIEQMNIPTKCLSSQKSVSCSACHKMGKTGCDASNKKRGKEKPETSRCIDCPLCLTIITEPTILFQTNTFLVTKQYKIRFVDNLSSYTNTKWKPPDVFSLLS